MHRTINDVTRNMTFLQHFGTLAAFLLLFELVYGRLKQADVDLTMFTEDIVRGKCGCYYKDCVTAAELECNSVWKDHSLTTKMTMYYRTCGDLYDEVSEKLNMEKWSLDEGSVLGFHKKSLFISQLVDDKRIKTVCEIGFNAGHSALNFLISNPSATLISFDFFDYFYSSPAANAINDLLFPNRSIFLVPGDTVTSIPQFIRSLSSANSISYRSPKSEFVLKSESKTLASYPLCNLIFIDGGHTLEVARSDLLNMKLLADPEYHIVLIDDYDFSDVKDAVKELHDQGIVKDIYVLDDIQVHKKIDYEYNSDTDEWIFHLSDEIMPDSASVATMRYNI